MILQVYLIFSKSSNEEINFTYLCLALSTLTVKGVLFASHLNEIYSKTLTRVLHKSKIDWEDTKYVWIQINNKRTGKSVDEPILYKPHFTYSIHILVILVCMYVQCICLLISRQNGIPNTNSPLHPKQIRFENAGSLENARERYMIWPRLL